MLWASWSAGQTFAQSTSHSWIYLVINSVSQAANQAVRPDDSFMHSIHRLVSDLNQPEDWNSVDTDADGLVLGGLGQAQSPPGAAGCQLTSWYFYPPLAGPEPSPIELGQATIEILYPLSVFGLQKKKKKKKGEIAKGGSGTLLVLHWVLLTIMFMSNSSIKFVCFWQTEGKVQVKQRVKICLHNQKRADFIAIIAPLFEWSP